VAFQTDKELSAYGPLGREVEQYGFDMVTVYNDMLYQPAWPALFEIARSTSTISLGPAAVNPFTSHPVNIAGYSALLDEASAGRSYLGLARGAWLDFVNVSHPKPLTALREALLCIDHLHRRDTNPLDAEFFSLSGGDSLRWSQPRPRIPKLLGSWGLKTLQYCYSLVDEVKLGGSVNPDLVSYFSSKRDAIRDKLGQQHTVSIVMGAVTVVDDDGEKARDLAKREVALYLPVIASLDTTVTVPADQLEAITSAAERYDFEGAASHIDDSLLSKFALAGTAEELVKHCTELIDVHTGRIEFGTPHGIDPHRGLHLLGKEVLPALKSYISQSEE
jgi:5,10-methylenetetrahydromethanopterin reductase